MYGVFLIFLVGSISLLIITGLYILIKAKQNRRYSLFLLAGSFLSVAFGFIGNFIIKLGPLDELGGPFQEYFIFIGFVSFVLFTNSTFYKKQMKKGWIILIIVLILGIIQLVLHNLIINVSIERGFPYFLRVSLDFPYTFIVFNWLTYSCYKTYKRLKNVDIEPWIKARYMLIAISSFILSFHTIPEFFQPKNIIWGDPSHPTSLLVFGITTILMMLYVIIMTISWVMPKSLKRFFNRNYSRKEDNEYTEEELMSLLKEKLTQNDKGPSF